jgi:hypothetical protein
MIVTVTRNIPQIASVQNVGLKASPMISTPMPMVSEIGLVGIPGPPGPPGPAGTIVHVGPTAPPSPNVNDLWVDTS